MGEDCGPTACINAIVLASDGKVGPRHQQDDPSTGDDVRGWVHLIRTWAGVNTSVDGRPVVGPVTGVPGLFFAIPGDAGYTLGPLTARLVADTMLGRAPEAAIGAYTADRFN